MVNWIKRVTDFEGNNLQSTEEVIGVAFVQPPGSIADATAKASFGLIGFIFTAFAGKKRDEKAHAKSSPLSKAFPEGNVIMASTSKGRILCYRQAVLSGKPNEFIGEYKKGDIKVHEIKSGTLKTDMTLAFSDGGLRSFELGKGQDYNGFRDSLNS